MFVVCINDFPFSAIVGKTETECQEICHQLETSLDARKKTGYALVKSFIHLEKVPVISGLEDILIPTWDNESPTILKTL